MANASFPTPSNRSARGKPVLKLVHRHGPCNDPFPEASSIEIEQVFRETLQQDQLRVDWLNSRIAASSSSSSHDKQQPKDLLQTDATTELPTYVGTPLGVLTYIVTVGLGTPTTRFSLSFDTGSDLSWVQCLPCSPCYQQQGPTFAPFASFTYRTVPCSAPECFLAMLDYGTGGCTTSDVCVYEVHYGDKSSTSGYLSKDTLTLTALHRFPGFTFGCGHKNQGSFGKTGGLLGLGRGSVSLISQTAHTYRRTFAYCLPTVSMTGYLVLGPDPSYASAKFTPLLLHHLAPFYFFALVGISVNAQPLLVNSSSFADPGTILDSGTVITRLPPEAYSALRASFRAFMSKYPLTEPDGILDTCYDFSGYPIVDYPSIAFNILGGIDWVLNWENIFYPADGTLSQVCLAFAPLEDESSVAIIGNWQQKGTLLVHDIPNARLGIKQEACNY
ncbi:aspartyl protease family protein At5g10770-like [Nymphaea colorata]|nr:aspartyl protease family protein At5g10770-like [Nymphaea colorata]